MLVQITGENCCLSRFEEGDFPLWIYFGQQVGEAVGRPVSYVALLSIVEGRPNPELKTALRFAENGRIGGNLQRDQVGCFAAIIFRALCDPAEQKGVFLRIDGEALVALVLHLDSWLAKNPAGCGAALFHPSCAFQKSLMVFCGLFAPERQFKFAFSIPMAVTASGIAAAP